MIYIAIPTYKRIQMVSELIESFIKYFPRKDYRFVVCAQAYSDEDLSSLDALLSKSPNYSLLVKPEPIGVSRATKEILDHIYMIGIPFETVCLFDDDVIIQEDTNIDFNYLSKVIDFYNLGGISVNDRSRSYAGGSRGIYMKKAFTQNVYAGDPGFVAFGTRSGQVFPVKHIEYLSPALDSDYYGQDVLIQSTMLMQGKPFFLTDLKLGSNRRGVEGGYQSKEGKKIVSTRYSKYFDMNIYDKGLQKVNRQYFIDNLQEKFNPHIIEFYKSVGLL
jgi:hypothetical protein